MSEPKISVIIPMYNAEKYIRECLISVLASKFDDYEVLVVDDCSTDNSVAEVEKLFPHFKGRLKILSTEKNSGGAGVPRNVGIKNSSAKYIVFVDADDIILPTALNNFFEAAEFYQADVVHAEKWFFFDKNFDAKNLKLVYIGASENFSGEKIPAPVDLKERIWRFVNRKFFVGPCGKIFRRDFLLDNEIFFPQMRYAEDKILNFKCLCLAKKYVFVPFAATAYRIGTVSTSRRVMSVRDGVKSWLNILSKVLATLDEFMSGLEFFKANPDLRRDVLKFCADDDLVIIKDFLRNVPAHELQKIFFDEFQNPEHNAAGKNILSACLCSEKFLTR